MDMTVTRNPAYDGFEDKEFVTSDQVTLHYMVKGKGKPLIFIHGWAETRGILCLTPRFSQEIFEYTYWTCGDMGIQSALSWCENC